MIDILHNEYNRYKLIEDRQSIEIYLGKNELEQDSLLFLVSLHFPDDLISELINTDLISINLTERKDGKTVLSFDLQASEMHSLFLSFAENMISFLCIPSNLVKPFDSIMLRYGQWRKLLKANHTGLLHVNTIRGLIGELLFLKEFLIPIVGPSLAIRYWTGPTGSDQDFKTNNTWYEVKTIHSGKESVVISSVEQLDTERFGNGFLVVYALDATVSFDPAAIKIKDLIAEIKKGLSEHDTFLLDSILFSKLNFYDRPEYDTGEYVVRKSSCDIYAITNKTTVMRKSYIPNTIISVVYELSLIGLSEFKVSMISEGDNYGKS